MQTNDDFERLIESLAEYDETFAHSNEKTDPGIEGLQSDLEQLEQQLRQVPPADLFSDESACQRALEVVAAIGRDPSFATREQLAAQEITPSSASPSAPVDLGTLGQYRLLAELGRGGMGAVYKALHTRLGKVVALKVLTADRLKDKHAVDRFEREMLAVGNLNHVNIVAAHDAGEINGTHYLVMELVEGIDLGALVKQRGRQPMGVACELIRQAALGLQHAHEHKLVHRDIKPSNLMLAFPKHRDDAPLVKVLDMGLALLEEAHFEAMSELTSTGQVMGTPEYMAPEQAADTHSVDHRADIYSLGASLYKLLTGTAPFPFEQYRSPYKLMVAVATKVPPPVSDLCPEITPEVAAVVHRMLQKDPADRYASARDLAEILSPYSQPADVRTLVEFLTTASAETQVDVNSPTFIGPGRTTRVFHENRPTQPIVVGSAAATNTYEPLPVASPAGASRPGRRFAVITLALIACGVLLLAGLYKISVETPEGSLTIVSEFPGITVDVDSDGKVTAHDWVLGKDSENRRSVRVGNIKIKLPPRLEGEFVVSPDTVTLVKGGHQTVKIERKNPPSAVSPLKTPEAKTAAATRQDIPADRERVAAELWQKHGGSGAILIADSEMRDFTPETVFPDQPFVLHNAWGTPSGMTNDDFRNFVGLRRLQELTVSGNDVNAAVVTHLKRIYPLHYLSFSASQVPTSALSQLELLPRLKHVWVSGQNLDDNWQFVNRLRGLRRLWISSFEPTPQTLQTLSDMAALREIRFWSEKDLDQDAVAAFQQKNPRCRLIVELPQRRTLGIDPLREGIAKLVDQKISVVLAPFDGVNNLKPTVPEILADPTPFNLSLLAIPPDLHLARETLDFLDGMPFTWLRATGKSKADALVAALPNHLSAQRLDLSNSDLTDAGLKDAHRFINLEFLYLSGTKVTREGVDAFHQAVPACDIFSDIGVWRGQIPKPHEPISPPQVHPDLSQLQRERAAAEWWLSHTAQGCWIDIIRKDTRKIVSVGWGAPLPEVPFALTHLHALQPVAMKNDDLSRFRGLPFLRKLIIAGPDIDALGLNLLAELPRLQILQIHDTSLKTSEFIALKSLPSLGALELTGRLKIDDQWGFIGQLPRLQSLTVLGPAVQPADWRRWAEFPQLCEIKVDEPAPLDSALIRDIQQKLPLCRMLTSNPELRLIGADPVQAAARQLLISGVELVTKQVRSGQGTAKLTLPDDASKIGVDTDVIELTIPPNVVLNAEELKLLRAFSGRLLNGVTAVHAGGIKNADSLMLALNDQMWLSHLNLDGSDITDQGLSALQHAGRLTELMLPGTSVTRAGVDAFQRRFPDCFINCEFGQLQDISPYDMPRSMSFYGAAVMDKQRAAASLWIRKGGYVSIRMKHNREWKTVRGSTPLPELPFELVQAWYDDKMQALTNQDLRHFEGLPELELLELRSPEIDDRAIASLKRMPQLRALLIRDSKIRSSALGELKGLLFVHLTLAQVDDGWQFAKNCPHLSRIEIGADIPREEDWKAWEELPQLRQIWPWHGQNFEAAAVALHRRNPNCRVLCGSFADLRAIGVDPIREAAKKLSQAGLQVDVISSAGRQLKPTLREILEEPEVFGIRGIAIPAGLKLDAAVINILSNTPVDSLSAFGWEHADDFALQVPVLRCNSLDLAQSKLTDKGLIALKSSCESLRGINVTQTSVSREQVLTFAQGVPRCRVLSDFGTFEGGLPQFAVADAAPQSSVAVDHDRATAEWGLSQNASCLIARELTGEHVMIKPGEKLPEGNFSLLFLTGEINPMQKTDIKRFVGLKTLLRLYLKGSDLDNSILPDLTDLKTLLEVQVFQTSVTTSGLKHLKGLPYLTQLTITGKQVDDDWGFLSELKTLRELVVDNYLPTQQDLDRLSDFQQLRAVYFNTDLKPDDLGVKEFHRRHPKCRIGIGYPADRKIVNLDPARNAISELLPKGFEFDIFVGTETRRVTHMKGNLPAESELFYPHNIHVPKETVFTAHELSALNSLWIDELDVGGRQQTDHFLKQLPSEIAVYTIKLSNSDLTDQGLARLQEIDGLKEITVFGTKVTINGLRAFQSTRPYCQIVSDFGVFTADKPVAAPSK